MPTTVQISPKEYLSTSYEGLDREYVRGEIVERSMPTTDHADAQGEVVHRFRSLPRSCRLYAFPELRMRLAPDVFRIPDVSVFAGSRPGKKVPDSPPLVAIEILSEDERLPAVIEKLEEYREWGVPQIWLIDPQLRRQYVYRDQKLNEVPALELPGYPIDLTSLFE